MSRARSAVPPMLGLADSGHWSSHQMLYRFAAAGTAAEITAGRAAGVVRAHGALSARNR